MVNHIIYAISLKTSIQEGHYPVSNQKTLQVDLLRWGLSVVEIDFIGEVRNVLSCVGFACNPEDV